MMKTIRFTFIIMIGSSLQANPSNNQTMPISRSKQGTVKPWTGLNYGEIILFCDKYFKPTVLFKFKLISHSIDHGIIRL